MSQHKAYNVKNSIVSGLSQVCSHINAKATQGRTLRHFEKMRHASREPRRAGKRHHQLRLSARRRISLRCARQRQRRVPAGAAAQASSSLLHAEVGAMDDYSNTCIACNQPLRLRTCSHLQSTDSSTPRECRSSAKGAMSVIRIIGFDGVSMWSIRVDGVSAAATTDKSVVSTKRILMP